MFDKYVTSNIVFTEDPALRQHSVFAYIASIKHTISLNMSAFSRVPSTARTIPTPFKVSIPEEQLTELKTLVKLAKLGPRTHENSQSDFLYGVTWVWMKELKEQWVNDFDW